MSIIYGGDGITFPDGVQMTGYPQGWRSRIINGDMRIDQRNAGASVTPSVDGTYTLDRWAVRVASAKFSVQQSTTAPAGFKNSLLITSTSAYSVPAGEIYSLSHTIEGVNIADLGWGTADAQPITISFRVRSSLTGTFGGIVRTPSSGYGYGFTYTINAANTFETKTVTIAGPTVGTWATDTNAGLALLFEMGCGTTYKVAAGSWTSGNYYGVTGATSVVGTNGATFYLTGVMLEKGSYSGDRPFDYVEYGEQERRCQRYCPVLSGQYITSFGQAYGATSAMGVFALPVTARTAPTGISISSLSHFVVFNSTLSSTGVPGAMGFNSATTNTVNINCTSISTITLTAGDSAMIRGSDPSTKIIFTGCEL